MKKPTQDIDTMLREHGMRATQARRAVYQTLTEAREPLSASDVHQVLSGAGLTIDPVTVYRTLDTLERCDLIARTDRLSEGWRYSVRSRAHHHSIVCSQCGSTAPLDHCDLERLEMMLEKQTGFLNIRHSLQFFGTCPDCQ